MTAQTAKELTAKPSVVHFVDGVLSGLGLTPVSHIATLLRQHVCPPLWDVGSMATTAAASAR
jgi:hypothetical protein